VDGPAVVLVHSPLVGPATWEPAAERMRATGTTVAVPSLRGLEYAPRPYWRWVAARVRDALPPRVESVVLVGHIGVGPLLPVIAAASTATTVAYVFVDAAVPPLAGPAQLIPPEFRPALEALATNGRLPMWSQWWGDDVLQRLIPDPEQRGRVEAELPSIPLAYFDDEPVVPDGWAGRAHCGYLQFSPAYDAEAEKARARGWPVDVLEGEHLHMLVEPDRVARRIIELLQPRP